MLIISRMRMMANAVVDIAEYCLDNNLPVIFPRSAGHNIVGRNYDPDNVAKHL